MPRSFYTSAIFFSTLYVLIGLIQSVIFMGLGIRIPELQSWDSWSMLAFLTGIVWLLILLKYFHYRQYWFAFWTTIFLMMVTIIHTILSTTLIKTSEYTDVYIYGTLALFAVGILQGVSLVLSKTGKRLWLKIGGILLSVLNLIMFLTTIWAFNSLIALHNGSTNTIIQWLSLIGSLVPVFFIMNFREEWPSAVKENPSHPQALTGILSFVAIITLGAMLYLGPSLFTESFALSGSPGKVSEFEEKIAQSFEARSYVNATGETLPYRLLIPIDYDSTQQYPLVVCLHGTSGRGTDNVKQVSRSIIAQLLSTQENRAKYPAFLLVPQCPPDKDWGGITNIQAVDSLVIGSISALEKEYAIDNCRRYLTGTSMGGFGAWHLITAWPDMFAAAIPIAGAGDPTLAQKAVAIPLWAFHGARDRNVLVRGSRDMIAEIKKQGGSPRYTEYPDKAHHISDNVKSTPGLLDWLFAQHCNTVP